jgi:hypothetical protein
VVEDRRGEHQPADQVGTFQGGQQRHRRPVAVADQVGRPPDDLFEEGDGFGAHLVVGDRPGDVGGAAVAAPVGPVHPEPVGEAGEVALEGARVGPAGMQQHQRRPAPVLLVPGSDRPELHVPAHSASSTA